MGGESIKQVMEWINSEIIITILLPGFFLSILFFKFFSANLAKIQVLNDLSLKTILFFVIALILGWTTHYIALSAGSKFIQFYRMIHKRRTIFLVASQFWFGGKISDENKNGIVPKNMIIYRNFFANLSLTFPFFLYILFDNYSILILSFIIYSVIALRIYIQCENAKVI